MPSHSKIHGHKMDIMASMDAKWTLKTNISGLVWLISKSRIPLIFQAFPAICEKIMEVKTVDRQLSDAFLFST